jgi:serine protease Do
VKSFSFKEDVMGRRIGTLDIVKGFFIVPLAFIVFFAVCLNDEGRTESIGFPQSFAELAKKVTPAVVNISTTTTVKVPGNPFRQFFGHRGGPFGDFFGDVPDREMKQRSLGSGSLLTRTGTS